MQATTSSIDLRFEKRSNVSKRNTLKQGVSFFLAEITKRIMRYNYYLGGNMRFINGLFMGIFGTLAASLMSYVWFNAESNKK